MGEDLWVPQRCLGSQVAYALWKEGGNERYLCSSPSYQLPSSFLVSEECLVFPFLRLELNYAKKLRT